MATAMGVLGSCSTTRDRPLRPVPPVKSCEEILPRIFFRDQFFTALRGKANFQSHSFGISADVNLAVVATQQARLEFSAALGLASALMVVNDQWVQFYVPKENSVIRFPKAELYQDTARRERFLKDIPLPVVPEAFFQGILTHVGGLPRGGLPVPQGTQCEVDEEMRAYRIRLPGNSMSTIGGRWLWVDGTDFYPIQSFYFERNLPLKFDAKMMRPSFEIRYSHFFGKGTSTLAKRIEMSVDGRKEMNFEWISAERWESPDPSVFDWRPAASMHVKDY